MYILENGIAGLYSMSVFKPIYHLFPLTCIGDPMNLCALQNSIVKFKNFDQVCLKWYFDEVFLDLHSPDHQ